MPLSPSDILSFLGNPDSYPDTPESVQLVQTHASYVAIVSPFVYKIKKPVDFGFLDFSTLEKRHYFCNEEVRLNSRLSTGVYEGVVPLYLDQGRLSFTGDGEPVEYAVKMRRLEDGWFMKQLLEKGDVGKKDIDAIVDVLHQFYTSQTSTEQVAEWGWIHKLKITTDENFEQTEGYVGDLVSRAAFETIKSFTNEFYDSHAGLFSHRRAEGKILDCHGDLHLEHIHLAPDQLTIYDCIEFNKRLRFLDVTNDIAFLCMDLDVHEERALAHYFAEAIAGRLDDPGILTLLDFYKCYRAYVRAKVNSFSSGSEEIPEDVREKSKETARKYYRLSLQYAVAGSQPLVIVVMGGVGTGKSQHAHRLSKALGWPSYSSDTVRKGAAGLPLFKRTTADRRKELYSVEKTEQVYGALEDAAVKHGAEGIGCVLDATYGNKRHRDRLRARLDDAGLRHCFIELQSPIEEVQSRVEARMEADDVVSDARAEDLQMLMERFESPGPLEDAFHFAVSTEPPREEVSTTILKSIARLFGDQ